MVGVAPVLTKRDMIARLKAGEFGNTSPSWNTMHDWVRETNHGAKFKLYGVRSHIANDPRAKLNLYPTQVLPHLRDSGLLRDGFNISAMVESTGANLVWEGDVYDHPVEGLLCSGNLAPIAVSAEWRQHMAHPRLWKRTAAMLLLRHVLNENSYDDLMLLVERYPDHVYEFSALDRTFGTVPGRNAVFWECRRY